MPFRMSIKKVEIRTWTASNNSTKVDFMLLMKKKMRSRDPRDTVRKKSTIQDNSLHSDQIWLIPKTWVWIQIPVLTETWMYCTLWSISVKCLRYLSQPSIGSFPQSANFSITGDDQRFRWSTFRIQKFPPFEEIHLSVVFKWTTLLCCYFWLLCLK